MNHFCIQAAQQVGDEVTKDEPITTNPNVGGFGQDGFGWELEIAVGRKRVTRGAFSWWRHLSFEDTDLLSRWWLHHVTPLIIEIYNFNGQMPCFFWKETDGCHFFFECGDIPDFSGCRGTRWTLGVFMLSLLNEVRWPGLHHLEVYSNPQKVWKLLEKQLVSRNVKQVIRRKLFSVGCIFATLELLHGGILSFIPSQWMFGIAADQPNRRFVQEEKECILQDMNRVYAYCAFAFSCFIAQLSFVLKKIPCQT